MGTTFIVNQEVVRCLRSALHSVLGQAAEAVCEVVERKDREYHREWYAGPLGRFDTARRLLDLVGWERGSRGDDREVAVDLLEYGQVLVDALRIQLAVTQEELRARECTERERARDGQRTVDLARRENALQVALVRANVQLEALTNKDEDDEENDGGDGEEQVAGEEQR